MRAYVLFFLSGLILVWATSNAGAHGTAWKPVEAAGLTAVAFHYSDGEAMAYAEVLVFSPQDAEVEHQNGRTDRHGRFAFCPDMPGTWRVTANDGMGHLCQASVDIAPRSASQPADKKAGQREGGSSVQDSKTLKIIVGLSLIVNLAFVAGFFRHRARRWKRAA